MLNRIIQIVFGLFIFFSVTKAEGNLYDWLKSQQEFEVKKMNPVGNYSQVFEIYISQPVDHNNPDGKTFKQKFYLSHISKTKDNVIQFTSYSLQKNVINEISQFLSLNQILVCGRFNPGSCPEKIDWKFLTSKQIAKDYHRIISILNQYYNKSWISVGYSKGAFDVVSHKRFFPDDIKASVVYTAPFPEGAKDEKMFDYIFNKLCTPEQKEKIIKFQKKLLTHSDEIKKRIEAKIKLYGGNCSKSIDDIFKFSVLEFPFSLWQFSSKLINKLPDNDPGPEKLFFYFSKVIRFYMFLDNAAETTTAATFHMASEIGCYCFKQDHLDDYFDDEEYEMALSLFLPKDFEVKYNSSTITDIKNWLKLYGNNIVYIYGKKDPWTAASFTPSENTNSIKIIQNENDHYVSLNNTLDKKRVLEALNKWLAKN